MDKEILAQELAKRAREEELLCYDKFSNEDALALGLKIIEKAKQRNAAVGCSGLAHTDDHQLLVDSIADILGVEL